METEMQTLRNVPIAKKFFDFGESSVTLTFKVWDENVEKVVFAAIDAIDALGASKVKATTRSTVRRQYRVGYAPDHVDFDG